MRDWLETKIRQGFEPNTDAPLGTPDNPSSKILTISNVITITRMILTIVFLYMFVTDVNRYVSVTIYAIAACTDWLDGKIARKTQTCSWFGKLLDPVCDRCLLFCGVLGLVVRGELPIWVCVWVIGRDAYLAWGMSLVRRYRERPIDVVYVGKIATACLMFGFCDMLLDWPICVGFGWTNIDWLPLLNSTNAAFGLLFVYVGCIFSFITAIVYTVEGIAIIQASKLRAKRQARAEANPVETVEPVAVTTAPAAMDASAEAPAPEASDMNSEASTPETNAQNSNPAGA